VRLAYHTGNGKLVKLKKHLVAELIKTQLDDGYIGVFPDKRLILLWDLHEMSYIIYALVQDYKYFDNKQALAAAEKLADFVMKKRTAKKLHVFVANIGIEAAFLSLYEATGKRAYLDYVNIDDSFVKWRGGMGGHAYTDIAARIAQLKLYRLHPENALLIAAREAVDVMIRRGAMSVMGTGSNREGWHFDSANSDRFGETCFTAYWLRLLHHLLQVKGDSLYGDVMERTIYNALFAVQSPDGRELHKYTPFEGKRGYYKGEPGSGNQRDAYCCPNNYRRAVADLPEMIYYVSEGGIVVNIYTPSFAKVMLGEELWIGIRQETDYPNSGSVLLTLRPAKTARFPLKLRIPRWSTVVSVKVNGKKATGTPRPGTYFVVNREWRRGDRVEIAIPMNIRLVRGRKKQGGRQAVARGPLIFCFNPSRQVGGAKGAKPVLFDLSSISGPVKDTTVRPDGLGLLVRAWGKGSDRGRRGDLEFVLTEYADPGCAMTYLDCAGSIHGAADELLPASEPRLHADRQGSPAIVLRTHFGAPVHCRQQAALYDHAGQHGQVHEGKVSMQIDGRASPRN